MQVWEHCFYHVVRSQLLQLQLRVTFGLLDYEPSVDFSLRADITEVTASLITIREAVCEAHQVLSLQVAIFSNVPGVF